MWMGSSFHLWLVAAEFAKVQKRGKRYGCRIWGVPAVMNRRFFFSRDIFFFLRTKREIYFCFNRRMLEMYVYAVQGCPVMSDGDKHTPSLHERLCTSTFQQREEAAFRCCCCCFLFVPRERCHWTNHVSTLEKQKYTYICVSFFLPFSLPIYIPSFTSRCAPPSRLYTRNIHTKQRSKYIYIYIYMKCSLLFVYIWTFPSLLDMSACLLWRIC